MDKIHKKEVLEYHSRGRKGKIEVVPTKPCVTQRDLSLAYTPGVAQPCLEIQKNPKDAYSYTTKGNLVAVITNGTAVLGLGNIGPLASKPVMEGKGVLFKRFADIDVFDIEVNTTDPDEFIDTVARLEPTFGGINIEDVRSPDCFHIEEKLRELMQIPVFHDDQHGTAIITAAALLNALEIAGKELSKAKVVFCGAGAAAMGCANLFVKMGLPREHIFMCDRTGVIYKGRKQEMNPYKARYAIATKDRTLVEAIRGADVFIGLSVKGAITPPMIKSMAKNPIVLAMANPDPEIAYDEATAVRKDIIMATGRSDYPNQVNNVLGFPFIFRGALDVRATSITDDMKVQASLALADLAKQEVPDVVLRAYGLTQLKFGPDYIIPKPFDPRVLLWVAPAVAQAAMKSGVAQMPLENLDAYRESLERIISRSRGIMREIINKAKGPRTTGPKSERGRKGASSLCRIVFPEGNEEKILRASHILLDDKIAQPILLGDKEEIRKKAKEIEVDLEGAEIIRPSVSHKLKEYIDEFYELRKRKGLTPHEAEFLLKHNRNYYGSMMVRKGDADGLVSGLTLSYPETIRPALQIIQISEKTSVVAGLYLIIFKEKIFFFADTTVNIDPTAEQLAEIAICTADKAKYFDIEPKVAMLSFSNFGSTKHPFVEKVRKATEIAKQRRPDLIIDGEVQADTAIVPEIVEESYPFCDIKGGANVLIFPDLHSGNIAYKLMQRLGGAEVVGPILMGMKKPVHVLQRNADVNEIVNMAAIAVVEAKELQE